MQLVPLLLSGLPIVSTTLGGLAVYKWKRDLHPWLSLSGGVLLGVAFLDLLPEALESGQAAGLSYRMILIATLGAILLFHLLDKLFSFHAHHEHAHDEPTESCENDRHQHTKTFVRASSMILHSLMDGVAIGGGFAIDFKLGLLVTLAVIMHDFSDGLSTVTILKSGLGNKHRSILPLLALDALAPFAGSIIGQYLAPSGAVIAWLLATFSGFFIFLSLSDLLPQAHSGTMSRKLGLSLTVLGILVVVFIQSFAQI